ncbi:hypothetical protein DRO97_01590 [Archaeoglobales archaeon]|nr:MAG: hypothetical protein DRO97_01590 [Archaeoglobales archaeon]
MRVRLAILKIALKDLKAMFKERTFVSIILLLVFVASFSSVITFGILALYNPDYIGFAVEKNVNVAIVGDAPILERIVKAKKYDSLKDALIDFYSNKIDAIIVLNENLTSNYVKVYLPKEEIKAIQASLFIKEKLVEYERELKRLNGIPNFDISFYLNKKRIEIPNGVSVAFKFIYVVLIPLLMFTTAICCGGLIIDSIAEEMETKTIELLRATPTSISEIFGGKVLASIILSLVLTPTWIVLLVLNGVEIHNLFLVILLSLSFSLILTSIAYFVVVLTKDRERSQLTFSIISVSIMPLLFTNPHTPASLIGRIAADGYFSIFEPIFYFIVSIILIYSNLWIISAKMQSWLS